MTNKGWPAPDTAEYEEVMDYIATGGKYPELLGPGVDRTAIDEKIAELRAMREKEDQVSEWIGSTSGLFRAPRPSGRSTG